MDCRCIDMANYPRREHFAYFSGLAYPYVGMTVNVDITALRAVQAGKFPFFLTFCYCVSRAANRVPELRQRILDGQIIEFSRCPTSHTVALPDGTYCYCELSSALPFAEYLPYAVSAQEEAKRRASIAEDSGDALRKIFISTVPWISYTALVQPVPIPADSNPRITWGRFFPQDGRTLLPVSVLFHHALVDGIHIAQFYRLLDEEIAALCQTLGGV